ncbi:radical SAM protein [Candidatus Margulisiibacteriota bacterium]
MSFKYLAPIRYNKAMPIIEPVIRPPAEAFSFLLQVTTGCSANTCTFCGAYKGKPFKVKDFHEIEQDIELAKQLYPQTRRVFLMDGNALILSNEKLIPILQKLISAFPRLTRISSYANGDDITRRNHEELRELANHKLKLIYIGLETGSQQILDHCQKKPTVKQMVEAVQRAWEANIKSSVIVLLGLGGKEHSNIHVVETIKALNQMQPRLLSFLSLMLIPGTELYQENIENLFHELSSHELLEEAYQILKGLEMKQTVFRCNHASNYLELEGRLPQDKQLLLEKIKYALDGKVDLRPEFFRGL